MKEKILAYLNTTFQSAGFSAEALEGVAAIYANVITDETQIATTLKANGIETTLKGFQSSIDKRVATLQDENKALKDKMPKEDPKPDPKTDPPKNETPTEKMLRELVESNKKLQERFDKLEGSGVQQTREQQLIAAIKDAPEDHRNEVMANFKYMKGLDDNEFTTFLTERTEAAGKALKTNNETTHNIQQPTIVAPSKDFKPGKGGFASAMKELVDEKLAEAKPDQKV